MFLTLTYDEEHLPKDRSLNKKHFQDFMKRYRASISPKKIKFYHCGEYGENYSRPHYHAIIFGDWFDDTVRFKSGDGFDYYISEHLRSLWPMGHHLIGTVSFESCAYVSRYVTKKLDGDRKDDYYFCDEETGEVFPVLPEYSTQSNGIGLSWLKKFKTDVWSGRDDDFVVMSNGVTAKPPRYYYEKLREEDKQSAKRVKGRRFTVARENAFDNTPERLAVKEEVTLAQFSLKERRYEK